MKHLALVILLLFGSAFSQTTSVEAQATISIGMELRLGMSRDVIISKLAENYRVIKIKGDTDDWLVEDKETPATVIGQPGFTSGKLTMPTETGRPHERTTTNLP